MASLITWLAAVGHRKSDGTPNASGRLFVVDPGTSHTQVVFADAEETATLSQPIALDAAGKATVYAAGPVDLELEDSAGASLGTLSLANAVDAALVSVDPANFTGPYLSDVAAAAQTSFGYIDFLYKESSGATARPVGQWLAGVQIAAKDFGAKGDGLAVDTSAIQTAINRCAARGGGRVYFDPGTYLIDAALVVPANVSLVGSGPGFTIVKLTNATANAITLNAGGSGGNLIEGLQFSHLTSSTGIAISCASTSGIVIRNVQVAAGAFRTGIKFDACSFTSVYDSTIRSAAAAGAGRGIIYSTSGDTHGIFNTTISPTLTDTAVELAAGGSQHIIFGCVFTAALRGVLVTSSNNNDIIRVIGCTGLSENVTTPFSQVGTAASQFYQSGNNIESLASASITSGQTFTPSPVLSGQFAKVTGTTTGSAYVVAAPANPPPQPGFAMTIQFFNNAGGAVTGWTLNATYRVASAISTTNLDKTTITFQWDGANWREIARVVTT